MTFQTTIVKPIALFIAAVLWSNGMYVAGDQVRCYYSMDNAWVV